MMTFSEKLVVLRKIKHLTQDDFASAVGVSRQAVYKWESGQSYPEAQKLIEIKLLFGISIDDLLDDTFEVELPKKKKKKRGRKSKEELAAMAAEASKEEEFVIVKSADAPAKTEKKEPTPRVKKPEVKKVPEIVEDDEDEIIIEEEVVKEEEEIEFDFEEEKPVVAPKLVAVKEEADEINIFDDEEDKKEIDNKAKGRVSLFERLFGGKK